MLSTISRRMFLKKSRSLAIVYESSVRRPHRLVLLIKKVSSVAGRDVSAKDLGPGISLIFGGPLGIGPQYYSEVSGPPGRAKKQKRCRESSHRIYFTGL